MNETGIIKGPEIVIDIIESCSYLDRFLMFPLPIYPLCIIYRDNNKDPRNNYKRNYSPGTNSYYDENNQSGGDSHDRY